MPHAAMGRCVFLPRCGNLWPRISESNSDAVSLLFRQCVCLVWVALHDPDRGAGAVEGELTISLSLDCLAAGGTLALTVC
jgi:hypothetical protein